VKTLRPSRFVRAHKVISARRGPYGGGPGSVTYSSDKYCDDDRFQAQVDALSEYLESAGYTHSGRPTSAPTYNIGSMIGSAIQHGTRSLQITVNYNPKSPELKQLIETIKAAVPKLGLDKETANQLYVDIGTIEVQISGTASKQSIIAESIDSIRNILEGAVGSAIASGLLPAIYQYFPK